MDRDSALYTLDGRISIAKALPYGIQHILAMFVANISPVMIISAACGLASSDIALMIQTSMLIAGIGTLIQLFPLWRIGSGLPMVMGISFTFVSIACAVGIKYGYPAVMGAVLIGGIAEGLLGIFAKHWIRFVTPVCSASVVTAIGFSLLPAGVQSFGGGAGAEDFGSAENWIMGTVSLAACIIFTFAAKGRFRQLAVLFGLVTGYIAALILGRIDLSPLAQAKLFSLPKFMPFGMEFHAGAILSFILIFMVSATETIGDASAIAASGLKRLVTEKENSGALACNGFVSSLSSLFGCMPITSFSQNVGLVAMTGIVNRYVIATGAGILILAGFIPALGTVLSALPSAVLGGCTLMMFASIVQSGFTMIFRCGSRGVAVAALSLSAGFAVTAYPEIFDIFPGIIRTVFAENIVATVFISALILDRVLPREERSVSGSK